MNNFVFIALLVFLGIVVVQGYGPKISRKSHGSSHKSSHGSKQRGSSHGGPPQRGKSHWSSQRGSSHHGSSHRGSNDHGSSKQTYRKRPHTQPKDVGKDHQAGHWENSPVWIDDQDSYEKSREDSGSYDSYDYDSSDYDSRGRGRGRDRDSSGPDDSGWGSNDSDYSPGSGSSEDSGPSSEEDGSFYNHFHSKVPCKRPHTKPPRGTTMKPTRRTTPHPTTPWGTPKPSNNNWGLPEPTNSDDNWGTPKPSNNNWGATESWGSHKPGPGNNNWGTPKPSNNNWGATESWGSHKPGPGNNNWGTPKPSNNNWGATESWGSHKPGPGNNNWGTPRPSNNNWGGSESWGTHKPGPFPRPTSRPKPNTWPTPRPTPNPGPQPTTPGSTPGPAPRPTRGTASTGTVWHPNTPTEETTHWETTTSLPETTTEGEEAITTLSPEITNCIASCASTPEYNPVCGSNGVTYDNEGKLFCANSCGVSVTLRRRSVCPPPPFDEGDTNDQTAPTTLPTTTLTPPVGRTTSLTSFQRCMRNCRITASFTPVCGTDLVTYMNMDRLKCAQSCGEVVEVLCEKPCAACGYSPAAPKTTTLAPTTSSSNVARTTLEPNVKECIDSCLTTQQQDPICGSDGVTYKNAYHLICAQMCGVEVIVRRFGPCSSTTSITTTTTTTTTTTEASVTYSPAVLTCIRGCPVTAEYNPVCGTDTLTYANLGNLECAKYCGVDVELKYNTRCIDEFDLDGTTTTTSDINGNKDVLTTTVKSTSLYTSPTTTARSTTTKTTPITTTLSTTTAAPISSSTLGFSIPQDVLDTIFKSTTAGLPLSTTTINPDADEDLDLDARFGKPTTSADAS